MYVVYSHSLEEQVRPVKLDQTHHETDLPVHVEVGAVEEVAECCICHFQPLYIFTEQNTEQQLLIVAENNHGVIIFPAARSSCVNYSE